MSYDVVILGLGYVGLPLAQQATRVGMSVLGFDVNTGVVNSLAAGNSQHGREPSPPSGRQAAGKPGTFPSWQGNR